MLRCQNQVNGQLGLLLHMEFGADAALWEDEGRYWQGLVSQDGDALYSLLHETEEQRARGTKRRLPPLLVQVECRALGLTELPLWCMKFMDEFSVALRAQLRCEVRVSYVVEMHAGELPALNGMMGIAVSADQGEARHFELSASHAVFPVVARSAEPVAFAWNSAAAVNRDEIRKAAQMVMELIGHPMRGTTGRVGR